MKKILTNRTLSAFEKWYYETHCKSSIKFEDLLLWQKSEVFDWLYSQCETIQYAFAVEFFDSVEIYIQPKRFTHCLEFQDWYFIITDKKGIHLNNYLENRIKDDSRKEAISKAFEIANEIFNNR